MGRRKTAQPRKTKLSQRDPEEVGLTKQRHNQSRSNKFGIARRPYERSSEDTYVVASPEVEAYKAEHIEIALQLGYPDEIVHLIEKATTESSVDRAMTTGRQSMKD